jgi:hypothetical protein
MKPRVAVETGVAAGWTSRAILEAQQRNARGQLWSSDFPYLKNDDPTSSIGCLVPESLRAGWYLRIEGDRRNLPEILNECGPIDLFHYDSDKSFNGRNWAMKTVASSLHQRSVVVMDDIQDNMFFARFVLRSGYRWMVIRSGGKYVGIASQAALPWERSVSRKDT